jgi:hypothetical protein
VLGLVRKSKAEELFREVLAERERVVQLLVEQLQYCRAQAGHPTITVQRAAKGEVPIPEIPRFDDDDKIEIHEIPSEDEEQLDAMKQAGVITEAEHERALHALRTRDPESIIE